MELLICLREQEVIAAFAGLDVIGRQDTCGIQVQTFDRVGALKHRYHPGTVAHEFAPGLEVFVKTQVNYSHPDQHVQATALLV
jgi:hypothetical protein